MKKMGFKWLILFTVFLILPVTVKAETKLECQYSGILPRPYGVFVEDEEDERISSNIVLDENGFKVTSANFVNGYYGYEGCGVGVSIDSCFKSLKEKGIRNFENFDKVRFQGINTLKVEDLQYKVVTGSDELKNYYVKIGKYTCPDSLQILGSDTVDRVSYNYGIFNVTETFSDTLCQNNKVKDFVCNQQSVLTLTKRITEANYDDNEVITKPSSGSCCVYKTTSGNPIYTFLVGSDSQVAGTLYACYGTDCMTCNGNGKTYEDCLLNSNYSHRLGSEFSAYRTGLTNCSEMPENLYYAVDNGKYRFYTTASGRFNKATLDPNGYCVSNNYTAGGADDKEEVDNKKDPIDWGNKTEVNCEGILGDDLLDLINKVFRWIQIIAPIFVIIMGSVDFAGAILQDDKDALKKASSKFIKRLIVAVALFFIPIILSFLLNIFNDLTGAASSTCGIGE